MKTLFLKSLENQNDKSLIKNINLNEQNMKTDLLQEKINSLYSPTKFIFSTFIKVEKEKDEEEKKRRGNSYFILLELICSLEIKLRLLISC